MIDYDFVKNRKCNCKGKLDKSFRKALKKLKHVVSPYHQFDAKLEDMSVVNFGANPQCFMVAYPAKVLGCVSFENIFQDDKAIRGTILFRDTNHVKDFTLMNNSMYIKKSYTKIQDLDHLRSR